jgi:hypothetical protein
VLTTFYESCVTEAYAASYAAEIREDSKRRKLHAMAARVQELAGRGDYSPDMSFAAIAALVSEEQSRADRTTTLIVSASSYLETTPPPADPIIEDLFEAGDKVGIIASAKRKKTWFTIQLAISVATGRPFLGWRIPRARRVLVVQPEIKPAHYHRRIRHMAEAMGITPADLGDRLGIVNARGTGVDAHDIQNLAATFRAELAIIDPFYKFSQGDENKAQDVKPTLAAFDRITSQTGAAVLWVHHDAKGSVGDRDSRDRGAGSNILIRDVDQLFTLTPHRDDPECTVLETLSRNYRDHGPKTITWDEGRFVESDLVAIARTSTNAPSRYAEPLRKLDATEPGLSLSDAAARLGCDRSTISRLRRIRGVA